MPLLKLGQADRERLGVAEALPFDLGSITNREAIQLRASFNYRTPKLWRTALKGTPIDADGNDVTDPDAKTIVDGGPIVDFAVNYHAWTALVWLTLRRAGVEVDPKTLEYNYDAMNFEMEPDPEEEPGKALEGDPAPSTNSRTTRSPSSRTSKRKSTPTA